MKKNIQVSTIFLLCLLAIFLVWQKVLQPGKGRGGSTPIYIIGLDGACWEVIDPLIAQNRLPAFKELKEQGAWARLQTFKPTLSAVIWTSIATGKSMIKHGIIDWTYVNSQKIAVPYHNSQKRAPSLWEIGDGFGLRSVVLGWFVTFPPDQIRGIMVSDAFSAAMAHVFFRQYPDTAFRETVYPDSYYDEICSLLKNRLSRAGDLYALMINDLRIPDYVQRYRELYAGEDPGKVIILKDWRNFVFKEYIETKLVDHFLAQKDADLFMAYFRMPDVLLHIATIFLEKDFHDRLEEIVARKLPIEADFLAEFYQRIAAIIQPVLQHQDRLLAQILAKARREKAYVIVVSDHGFVLCHAGFNHTALPENVPAPAGLMAIAGPEVVAGRELQANVYDIVPTVLYLLKKPIGKDMDGRPLTDAFLFRHPLRYTIYPKAKTPARGGNQLLDEKTLQELKSLGYIQ